MTAGRLNRLTAGLLVLPVVLAFLHVVSPAWRGVRGSLFDLDGEATIPAWFSSALLLSAALGAFSIFRRQTRRPGLPCFRRLFWLGFGAVFLFLSADEAATIHESLFSLFNLDLKPLYILAGLGITALGGLYFLKLPRTESAGTGAILTGWTLFWAGALGVEAFQNSISEKAGLFLNLTYVVEETLEMTGGILILTGVLRRLEDGPQPAAENAPRPASDGRTCLRRAALWSLTGVALAGGAFLFARSRQDWLSTAHLQAARLQAAEEGRTLLALNLTKPLLERVMTEGRDRETIFALGYDMARWERLLGRGQAARARLSSLEKSFSKEPSKLALLGLETARHLAAEHRLEAAIGVLEKIRPEIITPEERFEAGLLLGRLYDSSGRLAEAAELFRSLAEAFWFDDRLRALSWIELAEVLGQKGDLHAANAALDRCPAPFRAPSFFSLRSGKILALLGEKKYVEALGIAEELVAAPSLTDGQRLQAEKQVRSLRRKIRNPAGPPPL